MPRRAKPALALQILLASSVGGYASAQTLDAGYEPVRITVPDPTSPEARAEAEANRKRIALERELIKIRAAYFRGVRDTEKRQVGLSKLRAHTDPGAYQALLKVFAREGDDVYSTLSEMFADQNTPAGDAALAWAAIMASDESFRRIASSRMRERVMRLGAPTPPMVTVFDIALQGDDESRMNAAAAFADEFNLVGLIPRLISAQVSGNTGGGGSGESDRTGDLAFIAIGRQVAFVSDLTPVVSDSAVGYDPTVSIINEGTLIRVHDAAVTIYRQYVNASLVNLSSRATGRSTAGLGFDTEAWKRWYIEEFIPAQRAAELAKESGTTQETAPSRRSPGPTPPPPSGG